MLFIIAFVGIVRPEPILLQVVIVTPLCLPLVISDWVLCCFYFGEAFEIKLDIL